MTSPHPTSTLTPQAALERLRAGNARFLAQQPAPRDLLQQVQQTRAGQTPFAAVLGCIDSRAAPEIIFDQGIGDIFSLRVAGNILNADGLGSLEFACALTGISLILVLGHTNCGAVTGACTGVELGHLTGLLHRLQPAIKAVDADYTPHEDADPAFIEAVAAANVRLTRDAIPAQSAVLRDLRDQGAVQIVGAMYDVATGRVTFM